MVIAALSRVLFEDLNVLIVNLGPAVGPLIVAAVLAAALTPAAIALSRRFGIMAVPDGVRHRHARPMPLLGGSVMQLIAEGGERVRLGVAGLDSGGNEVDRDCLQ